MISWGGSTFNSNENRNPLVLPVAREVHVKYKELPEKQSQISLSLEAVNKWLYYYYYYYQISHFSALAGKYSPILDVVINRIRLGGLICSLKSFLQLNMCQELQIFAVIYICVCVCVLGCRLILVRFCDSDFGITAVDDITIGITCAAFCFNILLLLLLLLLCLIILHSAEKNQTHLLSQSH